MKKHQKLIVGLLAIVLAFAFISCTSNGCGKDEDKVISAYDIAVKNGFEGTEQEWLESLKGNNGSNAQTVYKSLYQEALDNGFVGSFDEFVAHYFNGYLNYESEKTVSTAADTAVRSAVSVYSTFTKISYTYDRRGNRQEYKESYTGAGAGVIISLDEEKGNGYVITNFHVIYDVNDSDGYADEIKLYVYGREISGLAVDATIIGATATYDVAVLKVENSEIFKSSNLLAAEFADSGLLGAGDEIFAVGNPEMGGTSVTSGIVSVDSEYITMTSPKDNNTGIEYRVIRIDAAVNGGNSGGGLFDLDGKLVGIVNAKIVSDEIDNIAYAIPSAIVKNVYNNIMKNCDGKNMQVKKCTVGVTIKIADSYAYFDPILNDTRIVHTVEVQSVVSDSAADGVLKVGDRLVSFEYEGETYKIERLYNLTDSTLIFEKDKPIKFTVIRDGAETVVTTTLTSEAYIA